MLANQLLKDVTKDDFTKTCYELITKTDYFDIYVEGDQANIKKTGYAIEIISEYLKEVAGKNGITGKQFRKKFNEIQTQLYEDISCPDNDADKSPFNFGTLFDLFKVS